MPMVKWQRASNYCGEEYPEYYILLGQNRDSDALERANFDEALKQLGGESETVLVIRSNHWAVGWIEMILIHESDKEHVEQGNKIQAELENYPVLDETRFSEYENKEVMDYWDSCGLRERIRLCQNCKIPFVASRHNDAPYRYSELYECLSD
jgi:hypothetical protein